MVVEDILRAVIALPLIFLLPGYILLYSLIKDKSYNLNFFEFIFIQILSSVLISGLLSLILAQLGYFSIINLIILLILFCVVLSWRSSVKFNLDLIPFPEYSYHSLILICILLIAIGLFMHPYPWILGGRDPGVYVNTGINIAKTGSIIIHDPLMASMNKSMQHEFYQVEQFPGFYTTNMSIGEVTPQFFYLWGVWISIFYSLFGLNLALYVTPLFALLAISSVYLAGKYLFNRNVGLIAALLLTLNFAEIWYARDPTTEVFTQFLIFSGIFTFALFRKVLNNRLGIIRRYA